MLHPDKQPTPALKTRAESQFRAAQRAYEVLSDPETRAVYDALGHRGLTHSWALTTTRGTSPQDLMRELEQASMRKAAEDAEALVKNKSDVEMRIDASTLFCDAARVPRIDPQAPATFGDRFHRVGTTQLSARHGFDVPLTQHTSANVAAQMVSRGRVGGGNLVGTIKTQWRPQLWTELTATAIRPHMGSLKAQWDVSQHT
jgi:DnaJ family protein C protein 11